MPREHYQRQLIELQDEILELGTMVDSAIDRSVESLKQRDLEMSRKVISDDYQINKKRFEIEDKCLLLIATQQPMARDLRTIAASLYISADLERMGDHAEGIAKINLMMGDEPLVKPLIDVPLMAEKTRDMLRRSLDAFVRLNTDAAIKICDEDDEIDALYDQIYRELLSIMLQDPRTITRATHLLWVAHNLERIADRVTNICERIVFMVTGKMQEINVSKY